MNNEKIAFMALSTNDENQKGKFKIFVQGYGDKQPSEVEIGTNIMEIDTYSIDKNNKVLVNKLEKRNKTRLTESAIKRNRDSRQSQIEK